MKINEKNVIPVLLGGDLNAYSVALAFREAYGVSSHAFVRYKCGATENSDFIKTHICSGLDNVRIAVPELLKFAAEHSGAELFLIPCADWYVAMLESAGAALSGIYNVHIPEINIWRKLSDKCDFYSLMKKAGIKYPRFVSFDRQEAVTDKKLTEIPYPAVLKPSDSTEYWKYPFPDMQKIYFPKNSGEAAGLIYKIFEFGYGKRIILQEHVGACNGNRVLTTFSDKRGRVVRAVLGEVILEERGKTSFGNHSAIITVPLDKISFELIDFLNKIEYKGFANFDIMADARDKYVLEVNTRQGRSCDYLRAAGVNIAELLVKNAYGEELEPSFLYKEIYWHYPPHKSVIRYSDGGGVEKAQRLYRDGKSHSPYDNAFEGLARRLYVTLHNVRLSKAIKKSFAEQLGQ